MEHVPGSIIFNEFIDHLERNPACLFPVDAEKLADEFRDFYGLQSPFELPDIFRFLDTLGIKILTRTDLPGNARGFHQIYKDQIEIYYLESEWDGSVAHTLLHETFEVIKNLFNLRHPDLEVGGTEANANLFAASVLMPKEDFLPFVARANFDIQLIRDKYYQSYFSLLIRLNYLLGSEFYYVGFTVINTGTYPYQHYNSENEQFESFELSETTKRKDSAPYRRYFALAFNAIYAQEDEKSTVTIPVESEYGHKNLLVATPVLNGRDRVRQIVIHVMDYYGAERFIERLLGKRRRVEEYPDSDYDDAVERVDEW